MSALIVDLPEFIESVSPSLLHGLFEQIAESINIAAAYQRFCLKTLKSTGLSEMARFKYQLMYDWACAEMNNSHYTALRICELTGRKLRVRHDYVTRRWLLEVSV